MKLILKLSFILFSRFTHIRALPFIHDAVTVRHVHTLGTEKTDLPSEGARVPQQIYKCHSNDPIHIKDEIRLFARGNFFHFKSIVQ